MEWEKGLTGTCARIRGERRLAVGSDRPQALAGAVRPDTLMKAALAGGPTYHSAHGGMLQAASARRVETRAEPLTSGAIPKKGSQVRGRADRPADDAQAEARLRTRGTRHR